MAKKQIRDVFAKSLPESFKDRTGTAWCGEQKTLGAGKEVASKYLWSIAFHDRCELGGRHCRREPGREQSADRCACDEIEAINAFGLELLFARCDEFRREEAAIPASAYCQCLKTSVCRSRHFIDARNLQGFRLPAPGCRHDHLDNSRHTPAENHRDPPEQWRFPLLLRSLHHRASRPAP